MERIDRRTPAQRRRTRRNDFDEFQNQQGARDGRRLHSAIPRVRDYDSRC